MNKLLDFLLPRVKREKRFSFPEAAETRGIIALGKPGTGKSSLGYAYMEHILTVVEQEPNTAVAVYDAALDFYRYFATSRDILFCPLAKGTAYWHIPGEVETLAHASTLARAFHQGKMQGSKEFFDLATWYVLQRVFSVMRQQNHSMDELIEVLENTSLMDKFIKESGLENLVPSDAAGQKRGVTGSLTNLAESLKLLPKREGREEFSATEWLKNPQGRILYIGTNPDFREALNPIISALLCTVAGRFMGASNREQRKYFLVDEFGTLEGREKLREVYTEGRKYNVRVYTSIWGASEMKVKYGEVAQNMISAPEVKVIFRVDEPDSAEYAAKMLGRPEQERDVDSVNVADKSSANITTERKHDYLIAPDDIMNLQDLEAFVKYGGKVTRLQLKRPDYQQKNAVVFEDQGTSLSSIKGRLPSKAVVVKDPGASAEVSTDVPPPRSLRDFGKPYVPPRQNDSGDDEQGNEAFEEEIKESDLREVPL